MMYFISKLFNKKKEKVDAEKESLQNDLETASNVVNNPIRSSPSNNKQNDRKPNPFMLALSIVALVLTAAIISAPSNIKKRRMKLLNRQSQKILDILKGHKKNVLDKVEELTKTEEQLELMKLDKKIKTLKIDASKKKKKFEELNDELDMYKSELNELTIKIDKFKNEANRFCGDCIITMGSADHTTEMTCNKRLHYLLVTYGHKKRDTDIKLEMMNDHPKCKKQTRERYDTSDFCFDCYFIENNDNNDVKLDNIDQVEDKEPQQKVKISCNERLNAIVKKYGYETDTNEVEDALMKEYNECSYFCDDCETYVRPKGKEKVKTTCGKRIEWKRHEVSDEEKKLGSHIGFKATFMEKHPECKKKNQVEKKWNKK